MAAVEVGTDAGAGPEMALPPSAGGGRIRSSPWCRRHGLVLVPVLVLPVVVVSLAFFPGHMSNDTLTQLQQVREGGDFTNHHAPLLSALWSLVWPLGAGPGWVLVAQVAVFVAAIYLLLRSFLSRWVAAGLAVGIALSPPVFGMLGYLSRDTWFTALLMAGFGLLARSTRTGIRRPALLMAAAGAALWFALASRQNAVSAVVVAASALVWSLLRGRIRGGWLKRALFLTAAGFGLTAGLLATQFAAAEVIDVQDVHPEQYLFIYDLEVLSYDQRRNLFPPDVMPRRGFAVIEQYYNIDSVNPLLFSPDPPVPNPLAEGPQRSLRRAWIDAVTDHPLDYLEGRLELWLRQVALTRSADFIYHPALDPNPWGYRVRFASLNEAARDYVEAFANPRNLAGGPVHTVWVYLLVDGVGAVVLLRRKRSPAQQMVGLLGLAAVTHQAGVFFGAMGTQYRFQLPVVVAGAVVLAALVQVAWQAAASKLGLRGCRGAPASAVEPDGDDVLTPAGVEG